MVKDVEKMSIGSEALVFKELYCSELFGFSCCLLWILDWALKKTRTQKSYQVQGKKVPSIVCSC